MTSFFKENRVVILLLIIIGYLFFLNSLINKSVSSQKNNSDYKSKYNEYLDSISKSIESNNEILLRRNDSLKLEIIELKNVIKNNSIEIVSIKKYYLDQKKTIKSMDSIKLVNYFKNEFKNI